MVLYGLIGGSLAILFAVFLIYRVMKHDEGTERMIEIASYVREGATSYLRQQYKVVAIVFVIIAILMLLLVFADMMESPAPWLFLGGGFLSALAGFIGMSIATRASARTANAARESLNKALKVAFSAGAVMGLMVVGLALLGITISYVILKGVYGDDLNKITVVLLNFGMGASFAALFARVGGGIFTKAADVGADLSGKVEENIPEDDPRNPAVIADNVGDNVGDVAGMGADLYESYVGSIIATMSLATVAGLGMKGVALPIMIAAAGIIASIIGTFFVGAKEDATQSNLLMALRRGIWSASFIMLLLALLLVKQQLPGHFGVFWAVVTGLIAGLIIGYSTEVFTSDAYSWTQRISKSAVTGAATVILRGLSVGMISTAIPVIVVATAIVLSYFVAGGWSNFNMGLYGIGLAAVGMLSVLGITLATDAYGPVADNAGGNAEMSELPPEVRERTDALDALGNTTAATGKGFAIGSAALTALALVASYRNALIFWINKYQIPADLTGKLIKPILTDPMTIAGVFVGAMMPFLFSAFAIDAVSEAAEKIVDEVRRQFREIKGLLEGKAKPDYASAVEIATKEAQKRMTVPSLMAIIMPILVGFLLGPNGVIGLLIGALTAGFAMALFMANAGGAWDNAKKYIEKGNLGGKGTPAHKAAVVGDTVGDPLKDTAGPSLNILIKLMSMVSIAFAGFVLKITIVRLFF